MSAQVQLIHGDCLEVMPTLAKESVAMVFADLPYAITSCQWDLPMSLHELWASMRPLLTPSAVVTATATFPFACKLYADPPLPFAYDLVWQKNRATGFFNAQYAPLRSHENVLVFCKKKSAYTPQMRPPVGYRSGASFKPGGRSAYLDHMHNDATYVYGKPRYPLSVITAPMACSERGIHPTQKPIALLEYLLTTYTHPGDIVIDPCAGSFTTAVAALRTGRRAVCIEKDHGYCEAGKARVEAEQERLATEAA